ncbi:MAG: hypothetical protein ACK4GT_22760, partial [Pararhodobacter sp.]
MTAPDPAAARRPLRVTLIGFSSRSDNLGVGALTVAQVAILRDIARDLGRAIEITIVDPRGPRRSYVTGPDIRIVDLSRNFLIAPGGYTGRNEFGIALDYPALIRGLIAYFQGQGAEVHLVAHVLREGGVSPDGRREIEDDYGAARDLAATHPGTVLAPPFDTPSEAKGYIAGLDFFMG